jgi:16S rRNA G966 N2-methylase RsmD
VESGKAIRENLRRLDLVGRTKVWITPVTRAVRLLAKRNETFDIIFLDPPYRRRLLETTLKLIAQGSLLPESGLLIAEHSVRDPVEERYASLVLQDQRRYGDTMLSFFNRQIRTP